MQILLKASPVVSDIPALVLAGEYDPVTSPAFTRAAADNLSNSYFYQLPYFGHAVQDQSNCANQLAASFMQNPNYEPDSTCLQNLSRIDFITSENDILPTKFVYWMNNAILQGKSPLAVVVIALCFLVFLIQLVVFVGKIKSHVSSTVPSLTALISLLNFAAFFWFYRILATTDVTLLGFGMPASASALFGLWTVIGILTVFTLVLQSVKRPWMLLPTLVTFSSLVLHVLVIVVK